MISSTLLATPEIVPPARLGQMANIRTRTVRERDGMDGPSELRPEVSHKASNPLKASKAASSVSVYRDLPG